MQRLESTQNASSESFTRTTNLSDHASQLLNEKQSLSSGTRAGDKYVTAVSFDRDPYAASEKAGSCKRADDACSWRPDESSKSDKTRNWKEQREAQRDKPLDLKDGQYEVKPGDTMSDIARRHLKESGKEPSNKDVESMVKKLAEQNKDSNTILKCNPHLIRPGMRLELPPVERPPSTGAATPDSMIDNLYPVNPGNRQENAIEYEERTNPVNPANRQENAIGPETGMYPVNPADRQENAIEYEERIHPVNPANRQENGIGGCRDYGFGNLPGGFGNPKDLLEELNRGMFKDAMKLPFRLGVDAPPQFRTLEWRPGDDNSVMMKTPYYPEKDAGALLRKLVSAQNTLPELSFV